MADISFSMSADEKDVTRALQNLIKENAKLRSELQAGANESKQASKEAAAAEREHSAAVKEATAIAEKYATKEEQVAAKMKRINELKEKGVLNSKDHARAISAETAKLNETGEAAGKSGGLIDGLTGKMTGFVAGLASAGTVITFLKSEYDALIERQGKSRDANISLAAEQEALLMNLGGADAKQVTGQISDLSKSSGIKEENVTRAVNEAMAARGDLEVKAVIDAVGSAAKVRKFAPSELAGLAAATIDTQKQTGLGTDESLGFLMQMQGQSRTKSLKGLAENFTPAVGGVMQMGADRQTAGGILASLSHGMGDTSGAQSATSAIQLAKQLRAYGQQGSPEVMAQMEQLSATHEAEKAALKADFDKRGIAIGADKKMPAEQKAELRRQLAAEEKLKQDALKTQQDAQASKLQDSAPSVPIADVIARMQSDPEYRKQFLKGKDQGGFGASFEAKALPAIESLLSGGTQATQYSAAKTALNANPLDALNAAMASRDLPAMNLAAQEQGFANITDQQRLGDTAGARSAIARKGLQEFRDQSGQLKAFGARGVAEDVMTGGMQSPQESLQTMQLELRARKRAERSSSELAYGISGALGGVRGSTPESQMQTKELEELIALTKRQIALQEAANVNNKDKAHAGIIGNRANDREAAR